MSSPGPGQSGLGEGWCPIVAGLDVVSTRAAVLVLREALCGATKFDEFVTRAGISPPIASARLRELVENGVLRQEPYRDEGQRTRQRYLLTPKGADLSLVLLSLAQWSFTWLGYESAMATHQECGGTVRPRLVCDHGHGVTLDEVDLGGPALTDPMVVSISPPDGRRSARRPRGFGSPNAECPRLKLRG
jgi:DNA-binding HxlR family transcriptional regulator